MRRRHRFNPIRLRHDGDADSVSGIAPGVHGGQQTFVRIHMSRAATKVPVRDTLGRHWRADPKHAPCCAVSRLSLLATAREILLVAHKWELTSRRGPRGSQSRARRCFHGVWRTNPFGPKTQRDQDERPWSVVDVTGLEPPASRLRTQRTLSGQSRADQGTCASWRRSHRDHRADGVAFQDGSIGSTGSRGSTGSCGSTASRSVA